MMLAFDTEGVFNGATRYRVFRAHEGDVLGAVAYDHGRYQFFPGSRLATSLDPDELYELYRFCEEESRFGA